MADIFHSRGVSIDIGSYGTGSGREPMRENGYRNDCRSQLSLDIWHRKSAWVDARNNAKNLKPTTVGDSRNHTQCKRT